MRYVNRLSAPTAISLLCTAFMGGVAFAHTNTALMACVSCFIFITGVVFNKKYILILVAATAVFACGYVRGQSVLKDQRVLNQFSSQSVEFSGKVSMDPSAAKNNQQIVALTNPQINELAYRGTVRILLPGDVVIQRGDFVSAYGTVLAPRDGSWLIIDVQNSVVIPGSDRFVAVREWFTTAVRRYVSEPETSLGLGFLVGQKSALPPQLMESIQILGLSHIVVASGYNLTVIIRTIRPRLFKISRFTALWGTVSSVWLFTSLTGFSPSMFRAALVATLSLATWYFGLRAKALTVIVFTAFLTVIYNPAYIFGDIGWYLSFLSFIGVLIVAPLLETFFYMDKKAGFISKTILETVSALIMTLPLTLTLFGNISPLTLFANLLVVPLIPLAMLLVCLAGLYAFLPELFSIASKPAEILIGGLIWIIEKLSSLSYSHIDISIPSYVMVASYCALAVIIGCVLHLQNKRFHETFIEAY